MLDLGDNPGLTGNIDIASLTLLETLNLDHTQLGGTLDISHLRKLTRLDVSSTLFSGEINISTLNNLQILRLNTEATNQLKLSWANNRPPSFAGFADLRELNLAGNTFDGDGVLSSLANLAKLTTVQVQNNQFSGSLPPMSSLPSIQAWDSSSNPLLTGSLVLGSATLQTIIVEGAQLTGTVPAIVGSALTKVVLSRNRFTALSEIGPALALKTLVIADNPIVGTLPLLQGLAQLTELDLGGAQLPGPLPRLSLPALQHRRLVGTNSSGNLGELLDTPNLEKLEAGFNRFSGVSVRCGQEWSGWSGSSSGTTGWMVSLPICLGLVYNS